MVALCSTGQTATSFSTTVDQASSWLCVQLLLRAVSQTQADTQTHVHILGSVTHLPALQRQYADCNKHTEVSEAGNLLFIGFLPADFPASKL